MDLFESRIHQFNSRYGYVDPVVEAPKYAPQIGHYNNVASLDKLKPLKVEQSMLDPVFKSKAKKPKIDVDTVPVESIMDTIIKEKPSVLVTRKLLKKYVNELENIMDEL